MRPFNSAIDPADRQFINLLRELLLPWTQLKFMVDAQQRLHVFLQFFFMKLWVVQYFVYLAQEPYVSTHGTVGRKNLLWYE